MALMDPSPRHTTSGGSGRQGGVRSSKEASFFLPSFFQVQLNPTAHLGSILSKSRHQSHILKFVSQWSLLWKDQGRLRGKGWWGREEEMSRKKVKEYCFVCWWNRVRMNYVTISMSTRLGLLLLWPTGSPTLPKTVLDLKLHPRNTLNPG